MHGPTAELLDRPDILRSVFLGGAASVGAGPDGPAAVSSATAAGPVPETTNGAAAATNGAAASTAPVIDLEEVPALAATDGHAVDTVPLLEVDEVSVCFGGIRAVDGVSLSVGSPGDRRHHRPQRGGQDHAARHDQRVHRVERGRVLLAGGDVTRMAPDERARIGLGRSFQDARLFPSLTVAETIAVAYDRWVAVKDPIHPMFRLPAYVDSEDTVAARVDELIELFELEAVPRQVRR